MMKLIGRWRCYFLLTKVELSPEYLRALKEGKAHLRKNPRRKKVEPASENDTEEETK